MQALWQLTFISVLLSVFLIEDNSLEIQHSLNFLMQYSEDFIQKQIPCWKDSTVENL